MKLEKIPKALPPKPPSSPTEANGTMGGGERFVWESLAPRLIHPARLAVIEVLLWSREPLSPADLREIIDPESNWDYFLYHCKMMVRAGVLQIATERPRPDGSGAEPCFNFHPRSLIG
jgi:hypothetical protein